MVAKRRASRGDESEKTPVKAGRHGRRSSGASTTDYSEASIALENSIALSPLESSPPTSSPPALLAKSVPNSGARSSKSGLRKSTPTSSAPAGPSPRQIAKAKASKYASRHVGKILDKIVDSEIQSSSYKNEIKPWLDKMKAKILRQISENSVLLFEREEDDPVALQAKLENIKTDIKGIVSAKKDAVLQKIHSRQNLHKPHLPPDEFDTTAIDSKAQDICTKFHSISQNMTALLTAAEDRVRVFENSLAAARLTIQANDPSALGAAANAFNLPGRGKTAAHALQDHLNTSY